MIEEGWAKAFAHEWIEAWNSHDLERIMSHYTDDFEMSSPFIIELMGEPGGKLRGKASIRPYWEKGLAAQPPLRFELLQVLVPRLSTSSLTRVRRRSVVTLLSRSK